jgi:hypothetical protein
MISCCVGFKKAHLNRSREWSGSYKKLGYFEGRGDQEKLIKRHIVLGTNLYIVTIHSNRKNLFQEIYYSVR